MWPAHLSAHSISGVNSRPAERRLERWLSVWKKSPTTYTPDTGFAVIIAEASFVSEAEYYGTKPGYIQKLPVHAVATRQTY